MTPFTVIMAANSSKLDRKQFFMNHLVHVVAPVPADLVANVAATGSAGKLVIAPGHGMKLMVTDFFLRVNSAAITGLTTLRLSTTEATPVDIFSIPQANLTSGSMWMRATTNLTLGAGFLAELAAGTGIVLRAEGSAAAGAFTIDLMVGFQVIP